MYFKYIRQPANALAFALRQRLHWSRGVPVLKNEQKNNLFDYLPTEKRMQAQNRCQELEDRYELADLKQLSTRLTYRSNLYVLDALEQLTANIDLSPGKRAIDIGCGDWHYVFALHRFLNTQTLLGIEVDGYGIYRDGYSRYDYARAYAQQVGTEYQVGDFLDIIVENMDLVTLFYPFLTRFPLLRWGLPLRFYTPGKIIQKAVNILKPGGYLVVFTQTSGERDILKEMLKSEDILWINEIHIQSPLVAYHAQVSDRWALLFQRHP